MKVGNLDSKQEQVVLGTIFGDGNLHFTTTSVTARFTTSCRDIDRDYIFWKYHKLSPTGLFPEPRKRIRDVKGVSRASWVLQSKTSPIFTELYRTFYPEGRKTIQVKELQRLDELGLAVWYMDDGCLHCEKKSGRWRVVLSTEGFSYKEDLLLVDWLSREHGFPFRINSSGSNRGYHLVLLKQESVKRFIELVRPHVVPCMERKVTPLW